MQVYSIRSAREDRAAQVVERLFSWSDRHHHQSRVRKEGSPKKKGAAAAQGIAAGLSKAMLNKQKQKEQALHAKNQKAAKHKLLHLLLHPHNIHRRLGNGTYNGRDHFLASKFSAKWSKITLKGRTGRMEQVHQQ